MSVHRYTQLTYTESNEHLENPNRGFVLQNSGKALSFSPLTVEDLNEYREEYGLTVHWRQYVLDRFRKRGLTTSFMKKIRADMEVVRSAKFTIVLRFMYTDAMPRNKKAPYGDATKDWMIDHIDQLTPIFTDYEDVIDVVQAGFIGVWGEWYYTTHFGDPAVYDPLTLQQWKDRGEVLEALLNSIPNSISVQVRTPKFKRMIFDTVATTEEEMKKHGNKSRIGHHNDCFLASSTDFGTYDDKSVEYPYMQADTKYTVMGGETCALSADAPKSRYKCPTATKELRELHFSYLNQDYHEDVINSWKKDGCFDDIHRHLGYRLVLKKAILPNRLYQGGKFCFYLQLMNMGYAAPIKQKTVNIMLRDKTSGDLYSVGLKYDLKTWVPGNAIIVHNAVYVPKDLPTGAYEMLLAIKDAVSPDSSDYNILLANTNGVPERKKGLNNLKHDVTVGDNTEAGSSSCPQLKWADPQSESVYNRVHVM
ncbi:hypothetical protein NP493_552g01032 [Ridgeia piscesae]|uniref:DUF4832 domain-containing protein n=1 Tax=Ridgeia piscesae TaxID=27915 RepID=A0AAD9KVJ3_RIDPI|nr:hypothetical protein NP493_552g01032 [Ridgeia piscesae]